MDWRSHSIAWYHHLLFFEATGDSEGDSFLLECSEANLQSLIWMNLCGLPLPSSEDDAESCSCDSSYMVVSDEHKHCEVIDFHDSNDTEEDEEEEEEVVVVAAEESRNVGGGNGSRKMMDDEMEGDRRFWETCLEAGYP